MRVDSGCIELREQAGQRAKKFEHRDDVHGAVALRVLPAKHGDGLLNHLALTEFLSAAPSAACQNPWGTPLAAVR